MNITINDLEQDQDLDTKAMKTVLGGSGPSQIGGWASMGTNARLRIARKKYPKKSSSRRFSTHTDNDASDIW